MLDPCWNEQHPKFTLFASKIGSESEEMRNWMRQKSPRSSKKNTEEEKAKKRNQKGKKSLIPSTNEGLQGD